MILSTYFLYYTIKKPTSQHFILNGYFNFRVDVNKYFTINLCKMK